MNFTRRICIILVLMLSVITITVQASQISGELKKWHRVTLTFDGPETGENAQPNPFLFYRLNVLFTHPRTGKSYWVPGYYAADGNAADSSAEAGDKWRAHFAPDETGQWKYAVSFRKGENIAVSDDADAGCSAEFCDGQTGSFEIAATDKKFPDMRARGRLSYTGQRYLQFAQTGEYFLKQGADAPENLLAYSDFDGDFKTDGKNDHLIKSWQPHIKDWKPGDPSWQGGKGKGLIGAINYLASEGLNVFSFLTFNIEGDDRNVFPYTGYNEKLRFDVSRLDQWEIVFEHGQRMGMFLHFKTQESENETWHDGGDVGIERKLYYRQLIACFSHHLALNWNLGEENGIWRDKKAYQSHQQRCDMAQYFWTHDPYQHHIVIHNGELFDDLLGDQSHLTGLSFQTSRPDFSEVHENILKWIKKSEKAGKIWAVACDESGGSRDGIVPDKDDPAHNDARKNALWGGLMAGGWGCEYYFGYQHDHSDLTCQDFRSRDAFWDYCRYALEFFRKQNIPLPQMNCDDALTPQKDDFRFFAEGRIYLIFQKQGGPAQFNLPAGDYEYGYFNPRTGEGTGQLLNSGRLRGPATAVFTAPDSNDWLLLVRNIPCPDDGGGQAVR